MSSFTPLKTSLFWGFRSISRCFLGSPRVKMTTLGQNRKSDLLLTPKKSHFCRFCQNGHFGKFLRVKSRSLFRFWPKTPKMTLKTRILTLFSTFLALFLDPFLTGPRRSWSKSSKMDKLDQYAIGFVYTNSHNSKVSKTQNTPKKW